jgi:putative membrane protein
VVLYVIQVHRAAVSPNPWSLAAFGAGAFLVWIALDWPIGPLGAGYLVSVHTISYVLLSLLAPPLLLIGWPRELLLRASRAPWLGPVLRAAARPLVALGVFNALLFVTHVPDVVDSLLRSQFGAFLVDLAWLGGGLMLWWAPIAPAPEIGRMTRPLKMAYFFAATVLPTVPAAFLTFADFPAYSVYELAPRVTTLSAHSDQQLAGLIMKVIGDLPLWFAFGVVFFRWAKDSGGSNPVHPSAAYPR